MFKKQLKSTLCPIHPALSQITLHVLTLITKKTTLTSKTVLRSQNVMTKQQNSQPTSKFRAKSRPEQKSTIFCGLCLQTGKFL